MPSKRFKLSTTDSGVIAINRITIASNAVASCSDRNYLEKNQPRWTLKFLVGSENDPKREA
jgi:hypothetical protein